MDRSFYATLDWMAQRGATDVDGNTFFTSIISRAMFRTIESCGSGALVVQSLSVDCNPPVVGNRQFKDNAGCALCKESVRKIMADRRKLEADAKAKNVDYTPQVIPTDDAAIAAACDQTCYSCRITDLNQNTRIRLVQSCSFDSAAFKKMLFEETTFAFDEQARKLSALLAGTKTLEDACTAPCDADPTKICTNPNEPRCTKLPSHDETVTAITNKLSTVVNVDISTRIFSALQVYQNITLTPSSSITISKTVQSFDISVMQEVVEKVIGNTEFYDPFAINADVQALNNQNGAKVDLHNESLTEAVATLKALPGIFNDKITLVIIIAVLIALAVMGIFVAMNIKRARAALNGGG